MQAGRPKLSQNPNLCVLCVFAVNPSLCDLSPGFMAKRTRNRKVAGSGVSTRVATTSAGAPTLPSWFRHEWFWGLILILFVLLVYTPIWHAGFIWDDDETFASNPCIVGPLGLKEIWTTNAADICPLVLTTFWVEHALWGLAPLPYHLVNILMHAACAVLLWRVLLSLCVQGAWLGAALWALHPVEVESVAWITEMKNTESALFFLLSILYFVKWLRAKELDGRNRGGWIYALSLFFAALSMASKSSTVILPVVLCLCAWWIEGGWHWRNVVRVVPMFLMSVAASALAIWTQGLRLATATDPQWVRPWPQRLAAAGDAIWFYLGKLLWPDPLITIYPRWQIDAGSWVSYLPLLAVILLFAILWAWAHYWSRAAGPRACFFALAYFLTALLPVLGLIDTFIFRYSLVFDHFQYLASIGPLALAGAGLARFSDFVFSKGPWLQSALCAGLVLILGMTSWQRAWVYRSQETLWSDTLTTNADSWLAHNNLGLVFLKKGQADEAIEQFRRTVEINPNYTEGQNNLANTLLENGQLSEAIEQYKIALKINPKFAPTYANLGVAFIQEGQLDEAIAQYQKAIEINPKFAQAHGNLGLAFFQKGQLEDAITECQEALRLNPNLEPVRETLAKALESKK